MIFKNKFQSDSKLFQFSNEFVDNVSDVFGATGQKWINDLPAILDSLMQNWNAEPIAQFSNLTYSFVVRVKLKGGQEAVVKIAPPCGRTQSEIAWYRHNSVGTPKLLGFDMVRGALLLERLLPGHTLKQLIRENRDEEATEALAQVILKLSPSKGESFKHVRELVRDLDVLDGKVDARVLERARSIFRELTLDTSKDVCLHGDIHHDNVVASGSDWLLIDPHGYLGPRCFEVGAMIRNPYDVFPRYASMRKILGDRLRILQSNLPFSAEEISGWAYAYTILATAWSVGGHGEVPKEHIEILEVLETFL